jgi:hypothetical protein
MGMGEGKGKAIPLQAWTGPEGSRRLRFTDFKTIGTFLDAATLTEVFPCFFLSCKANARV